MALKSEEIVPVFATEPSKIDTSLTKMPRAETPAEILPTLLMSPVKVVTSVDLDAGGAGRNLCRRRY